MTQRPTLIIPDVHQDARFLSRCRAVGDRANASDVILIGDILDGRRFWTKRTAPALRTLKIVEEMLRDTERPTTLLWGNHDWKYWRERKHVTAEPDFPSSQGFIHCAMQDLSLCTIRALTHGRERQPWLFPNRLHTIWERFAKLAVFRHGHLITHAGVHPKLYPRDTTPEKVVEDLNFRMRNLVRFPDSSQYQPVVRAGPARGGSARFGGPLWLDWDAEFEDALPVPQIVGHTPCATGARQKGRSWCLDGGQTVCALLHPNQTVEVVNV